LALSTRVAEELAISPFGSMEAVGSSETLVSVYKTTRRHVPYSRNMDHIKHCCFNDHIPSYSVYKTQRVCYNMYGRKGFYSAWARKSRPDHRTPKELEAECGHT